MMRPVGVRIFSLTFTCPSQSRWIPLGYSSPPRSPPQAWGKKMQPASLVYYEGVRPSLVQMLVQMCARLVQMSESGVLVEEL